MQSAFEQLTVIARQNLSVKTLPGQTKTRNHQAIRLVEKTGFRKYLVDNEDTIIRKALKRKITVVPKLKYDTTKTS